MKMFENLFNQRKSKALKKLELFSKEKELEQERFEIAKHRMNMEQIKQQIFTATGVTGTATSFAGNSNLQLQQLQQSQYIQQYINTPSSPYQQTSIAIPYPSPYGFNYSNTKLDHIHLVVLFVKLKSELNLLIQANYNDVVFCMEENKYYRCSAMSMSNQAIQNAGLVSSNTDTPQWVEVILNNTDQGFEDKIIPSNVDVKLDTTHSKELFDVFEKNIKIPEKNLIEEKQNHIKPQVRQKGESVREWRLKQGYHVSSQPAFI